MDIDGDPKMMARRLRAALAQSGHAISHSQALELVAKAYGAKDWNILAAGLHQGRVTGGAVSVGAVPVLRVFARDSAHAFYVDGLGFELVDEQGRADMHEPVRMLVSLNGAVLQLTEHNDDASPGGAALITVADVVTLHAALERGEAVQALAGVEHSQSGPMLVVVDPFRNRLVFHEGGVAGDRPAAGPITHELRLHCTPEDAFATFTGRINRWWPDGYAPGPLRDVRIEPLVGGAVVHELTSGDDYTWGTVLTWDPGRRYRQSFTLAQDPAHPSELDVTFNPEGDGGTIVHFAHGGWTAGNLDRRTGFDEWPYILGRFAVLADGGDPNAED